MSTYITSDADILNRIKKLQYRQQILPLALIAASFIISALLQSHDYMKYLGYALTMTGVALYIKNFLSYRYRNRILKPNPEAFYAPLSGKVKASKAQGGIAQLSIQKHWMDPVEIRCPGPGCYWQDESLKLPLKEGQMVLRFSASRLIRIPNAQMNVGEVIALMIGSGSCQISIPEKLGLAVHKGENLEAGESALFLIDN